MVVLSKNKRLGAGARAIDLVADALISMSQTQAKEVTWLEEEGSRLIDWTERAIYGAHEALTSADDPTGGVALRVSL